MDFCLNAFEQHDPEKQAAVLEKTENAMLVENVEAPANLSTTKTDAEIEKKALVDPEGLSQDEMRILNTIRARQMLRREDTLNIDSFSNDAIHGFVPIVKQGSLSLLKVGREPDKSGPKGPAIDEHIGDKPDNWGPKGEAMDELTGTQPDDSGPKGEAMEEDIRAQPDDSGPKGEAMEEDIRDKPDNSGPMGAAMDELTRNVPAAITV